MRTLHILRAKEHILYHCGVVVVNLFFFFLSPPSSSTVGNVSMHTDLYIRSTHNIINHNIYSLFIAYILRVSFDCVRSQSCTQTQKHNFGCAVVFGIYRKNVEEKSKWGGWLYRKTYYFTQANNISKRTKYTHQAYTQHKLNWMEHSLCEAAHSL